MSVRWLAYKMPLTNYGAAADARFQEVAKREEG